MDDDTSELDDRNWQLDILAHMEVEQVRKLSTPSVPEY